ncbi:alpha/beta fold hydrolase [Streptomyces sp. MNP-20]|uniref:alpha/beta hydrolase family protein n=1 Tax=Streptomyces sp. MNP-20 TaxID=2721165 RepID=UPI001C1E31ED|nr:alpha/beta fold hydrolase [Streptomyces sp. MNP-20]
MSAPKRPSHSPPEPVRVALDHSGARLAGFAHQPAGPPLATLVLFPALGVPASYYAGFCRGLGEHGIAVLAVDLRGQGDSSPPAGRATRYGYHDLASRDWPAAVAAARRRFGALPVCTLGHSIGGQISLLHASLAPETVSGVALVAAGSVDHRGFRGSRRLAVLAGTQCVAAAASVWGYWPGHRLGFGGRQSALLMRDWARLGRTGRFAPSGADVNYEQLLARVTSPVLALSVEGDRLAPPTAVDRLCEKAPGARLRRSHYAPPDGSSLDHFRWTRHGVAIAAQVRAWMETDVIRP